MVGRGSGIVGRSRKLAEAVRLAERCAASSLSVLIAGPTGAGKELIARHIHRLSQRTGPFVDVNCGAIPTELFEGMLFGRRRGAFTGAHETVRGLIEAADHGTLFLDELISLPLAAQSKLLRVLEAGEVRRVGDLRSRGVDFRSVSAAQDDVWDRVGDGALRHDLLQRVAGVVITVPGLAERPEDIAPLARHFAREADVTLSRGAVRILEERPWPGNVRELRAAVARAALFGDDTPVPASVMVEAVDHGPARYMGRNHGGSEDGSLTRLRARMKAVCEECDWNAELIAERLGVGRTTVFRRLKRVGLSLRRPGLVPPSTGSSWNGG